MSGSGWWMASDGRWYPPHQHPSDSLRQVEPGRPPPSPAWILLLVAIVMLVASVGVAGTAGTAPARHLACRPEDDSTTRLSTGQSACGSAADRQSRHDRQRGQPHTSDFPENWRSIGIAGSGVTPYGDNPALAACLGASRAGVGLLTGSSATKDSPRAILSNQFVTGHGPLIQSTVVTTPSAGVERQDLARYSSRAVEPCLTQWYQSLPNNYVAGPSVTARSMATISGVQGVSLMLSYEVGAPTGGGTTDSTIHDLGCWA